MCQCLVCDCMWCNMCKVGCPGLSLNCCCCSVWCCKSEELDSFNYNCITCCEKSGLGAACLGFALICCAPEWLGRYSKKKASLYKAE